MIETASFEEVTQIRMSREIGGKPVYWVSAYLVDGLLIDTGRSAGLSTPIFTRTTSAETALSGKSSASKSSPRPIPSR
jgi:hypothetical protein